MNWLFYGEETFLINQEIAQIAKQKQLEPKIFDHDHALEDILLEISTVAMFFDAKLIVVRNHPATTTEKQAKHVLERLIASKNSVHLILVFDDKKIFRTSLSAFIETSGTVKEFARLDSRAVVPSIKEIVKAKGGTITNGAAVKMALKVPEELGVINAEIEKLLLQNFTITEEMIEASIGEYVKNDYFALSNALAAGESHSLVLAYRERLRHGDEPGLIIGQIAGLLNLCLQVAAYRGQGMTNQDIADQLKIHLFRIRKAFELIGHAGLDKIKELVIKLSDLERDIKTGRTDPQLGLDYFILQTINQT